MFAAGVAVGAPVPAGAREREPAPVREVGRIPPVRPGQRQIITMMSCHAIPSLQAVITPNHGLDPAQVMPYARVHPGIPRFGALVPPADDAGQTSVDQQGSPAVAAAAVLAIGGAAEAQHVVRHGHGAGGHLGSAVGVADVVDVHLEELLGLGSAVVRLSHPGDGAPAAGVGVRKLVLAQGHGCKVGIRGDGVDRLVKFNDSHVVPGTWTGTVGRVGDDALDGEDVVVVPLVLARSGRRPGSVRADVPRIHLVEQVVGKVVGHAVRRRDGVGGADHGGADHGGAADSAEVLAGAVVERHDEGGDAASVAVDDVGGGLGGVDVVEVFAVVSPVLGARVGQTVGLLWKGGGGEEEVAVVTVVEQVLDEAQVVLLVDRDGDVVELLPAVRRC